MDLEHTNALYRCLEMIIIASPFAGLGAMYLLQARMGGFIVSTILFNVLFGLFALLLIWLYGLAH